MGLGATVPRRSIAQRIAAATEPLQAQLTSLQASLASLSAVATPFSAGLLSASDKLKLDKTPVWSYRATSAKTVSGSTKQSCIPAGNGTLTVPSTVFDIPGYAFMFEAAGRYTCNGLATISMEVVLGSTVTLSISALALPSVTSRAWMAKGSGTIRASRVLANSAKFEFDDGTKFEASAFTSQQPTISAGDKVADMQVQWAGVTLGSSSITFEELFLAIVPSP